MCENAVALTFDTRPNDFSVVDFFSALSLFSAFGRFQKNVLVLLMKGPAKLGHLI